MRSLIAIGLVSALAAACGRGPEAPAPPVNVLLLSVDTLRADHLGCYGYDRPTSPTLDALAARGVLFEDATSPAPSILPAHASVLTGWYPRRHGARRPRARLSADVGVATLAETLAARGLKTAAFVNAAEISERSGLDRGFEDFVHVFERIGSAEPSAVWDAAMMWLTKWREQPFFLFVHTSEVASDYKAMTEYETRFARPYAGIADGTRRQLLAFRQGRIALAAADAGRLVDLYDAGIRQMDDGVARLVRFMRRLKAFDATLVVVTSDHGEEFFDHGGVLHGHTLFQEVMRVPFIVLGPGVPAGRRVTEPVSLVDVAPTILHALGLASPAGIDGVALQPSWTEPAAREPASRAIFAEASGDGGDGEAGGAPIVRAGAVRAVRAGRLKLVYDRATERTALFDLDADPGERTDIAGARPDSTHALRSRLEQFMRDDPPDGRLSSPPATSP